MGDVCGQTLEARQKAGIDLGTVVRKVVWIGFTFVCLFDLTLDYSAHNLTSLTLPTCLSDAPPFVPCKPHEPCASSYTVQSP
jgi:hypothetical protein